jgi:hypothetical protein
VVEDWRKKVEWLDFVEIVPASEEVVMVVGATSSTPIEKLQLDTDQRPSCSKGKCE